VLLIKRVFDYLVWVMFFVLLILGGIIFVTDRTYPGDKLYSFKLKFEDFALVTSKILNKQVDFNIALVSKRSKEIAKILTPKNSGETLNRLDTQVELTADSISQIENPVEKKKAATKYIAKLTEVSSTLAEKKKEFVATPTNSVITPQVNVPQVQNNPTSPPTPIPTQTPTISPEVIEVSEQIDNTQETIEETIEEMTEIINQPTMQNVAPAPPIGTTQPTDTPTPTINSNSNNYDSVLQNSSDQKTGAQKEDQESTPIPTQDNTPIPTEIPVNN